MRAIMLSVLIIGLVLGMVLTGCNSQSHIVIPSTTGDPNQVTEVWGPAADTLAGQMADNLEVEAGRLADLFKYNAELFVTLFVVFLAGLAFAYLTKSSWGWVIPAVAGLGLLVLIFIVQAVVYIKWIVLAAVIIAVGVLVYKAYEYQQERNALAVKTTAAQITKGSV
jgi:hypothetical protein